MNDVAADTEIDITSAEIREQYNAQRNGQHANETRSTDVASPEATEVTRHGSPAPTMTKRWVEEDASLALPTRWWYAQTAFPLCAGTFGPMANAFSICALVQNWRVQVPAGGKEATGTPVKDPEWLIVVNAISLACAIVANISLLLNMARRLSFSVAQSITIIGFWVSSVLLIALIARACHGFVRSDAEDSQALTQAFYYACWAAGIYQIISYLMCVTVYGALKEKYARDFQLTTAQRTLMLQTISFLAYLLIGALIFSHVEGWEYLDAVYWADFTLLTVGIGDFAPMTHTGRSLLFPFAVGGIVVLGLVVSSIRSMILVRGKAKHSARMTEKIRRRVVEKINQLRDGNSGPRRRTDHGHTEVFKKIAAGPNDSRDTELKRRETEFGVMRKVQDYSEKRQKWMNLFVSGTAWAALWFLGALIFSFTERNEQQWSYFVSVYFAYTSLLTIGYGDFSPSSDAGKAFFVFWSLLAIPSLTILISDMSDTVVRFVRDVTIWLGEVTILPSNETSIRESLEHGLAKSTWNLNQKLRRAKDRTKAVSSDLQRQKEEATANDSNSDENKDQTDRMAQNFEAVEHAEENEARKRHDRMAESGHRYRRALISELRRLYADSHLSAPKKYTYDEWTHFLKLLGQDEGSSNLHVLAPLKTSPEFGESPHQWSWIGPRSPLMSNKHESALLLDLFFERLEDSLKESYEIYTRERNVKE